MKLTTYLRKLIHTAAVDLELPVANETSIHLEHPTHQQHGEYSTNGAMVWFSQLPPALKEQYPQPRSLAQALVAQIQTYLTGQGNAENYLKKIEIAGPGFINFYATEEYLISEMTRYAADAAATVKSDASPELAPLAIVEYSSPNIAKPFTIGHLRSTIIGDAIANLLEATGWRVLRDNHLGDWGTQFGKQIYALKFLGEGNLEANLAKISAATSPVHELVNLYVEFHQKAETDPQLEEAGREWFKKLEDGDPEARELWQKCVTWSWVEFNKIYERPGVKFSTEFDNGRGWGEAYFEDKMADVVTELTSKGLLQQSEGAKLVFFDDEKLPPLMILKKDGSTLYATRDLATDKHRLTQFGSDVTIINEVGAEQSLYFRQLFALEEKLGWVKPGQRVHIGHGLFRFQDKKMSTRKGNVVWLETVLTEAFKRAQSRAKSNLPEASIWKIAMGALKWNDLRREAHLPVVFDFDELLSLQGNSGPYMQYSYVRAKSVLEKAPNFNSNKQIDILVDNKSQLKNSLSIDDYNILKSIYIYSEIVERAALEYTPHYLANYLFELAQQFNHFYATTPIANDPTVAAEVQQFRLVLTTAVANILHHGLQVLGVEVVEVM